MRHKLNAAQLEWLNKWFEPSEIDSADWVVYSYKDWLEGQSMGPLFTTTPEIAAHYLDETKTKRKKGEGKLTVWLLPESEWLRIQ